MDPSGERELAKGLREGSGQAWRTLYDAFALRIWSSVARRVGSCQSDVADIVQETFLAAARSARSFDAARGSLWCWLSGIARNQTALHFRKCGLRGGANAGEDPLADLIVDREPLPEELLATKELATSVRRTLSLLPVEYETLLVGKYMDELSLDDLAAAEQTTSSAISSKLARARRAFRDEFEKQTTKPAREASR